MTPREKRLLRLVDLRERQHDTAALHLRAARGHLARVESAVTDAQERTRVAQLCRLAAAAGDDPNEWLLACADIEVGALTVGNRLGELGRAKEMAQKAAEAESVARRERKQMEATLELVKQESAQREQRAEQGTLDEIARMQRAQTIRHSLSREEL